jgi:hypothetical protein
VLAEVPGPPRGFRFEPIEAGEADEPGAPRAPRQLALDPAEVETFLARLRAAVPAYVHTVVSARSSAPVVWSVWTLTTLDGG